MSLLRIGSVLMGLLVFMKACYAIWIPDIAMNESCNELRQTLYMYITNGIETKNNPSPEQIKSNRDMIAQFIYHAE